MTDANVNILNWSILITVTPKISIYNDQLTYFIYGQVISCKNSIKYNEDR